MRMNSTYIHSYHTLYAVKIMLWPNDTDIYVCFIFDNATVYTDIVRGRQ